MYKRKLFNNLHDRLAQDSQFIQVLVGPRQVGKTTIAEQIQSVVSCPVHFASADEPSVKDAIWVEQQWEVARLLQMQKQSDSVLLILDEIQKIPNWSEKVKLLWDQGKRKEKQFRVLLLGSSQLLLQAGLTESLAGRFELSYASHWEFSEMQEAFGFDLDQYIYFGGYPGAASLIEDESRWRRYILDSLVETTISRDILLMERVNKPALLRQLFQLSCDYSGQILSYQKMLGQLHDAGNTTTLAHYLELLATAGLVTGLQKYSPQKVVERGSSPKLQVLDTGLMSAMQSRQFNETKADQDYWGRMVESCVGMHLTNQVFSHREAAIYYWRDRGQEVDFVLQHGKKLLGIEVKSGAKKGATSGMATFAERYKQAKVLQVGGQGYPIEDFLKLTIEQILDF